MEHASVYLEREGNITLGSSVQDVYSSIYYDQN